MNQNLICADVETAPLDDAEILRIIGPFNPDDVKLGNVKDPDKIAAKLAEAEASYLSDARESAALSPLTGRVLAIGWKHPGAENMVQIIGHSDEAETLREFFKVVEPEPMRSRVIVGHDWRRFDGPLLAKRAIKLGVKLPFGWLEALYSRWSDGIADTCLMWRMGDNQAVAGLDAIARFLGLPAKLGSGKDFARLWREDRAAAEKYLARDVEIVEQVWRRLA